MPAMSASDEVLAANEIYLGC